MAILTNIKFGNSDVLNITYNGQEVSVCRYNDNLIYAPEGFIDINSYLSACEAIETYLINQSSETTTQKKYYEAAIKLADMGRCINTSYTSDTFSAIYGSSLGLSVDDMSTVSDTYKTLFKSGINGVTILLLNNNILDISHFWAALEAYIRKDCVVDTAGVNATTYPHCGGWLGDTISMAADIKNGVTGDAVTFRNSSSKFSTEDWNSDIDAANIYTLFYGTNKKLSEVLKDYFTNKLTEKYRVNTFINKFGSFSELYNTALTLESFAVLSAEYAYGLITTLGGAGTADSTYVPLVISLITAYINSLE